MAYVPPHKKNKVSDEKAPTASSTRWAARKNEGRASSFFYSLRELCDALGTEHLHTMTDSPVTPDALVAIAIHNGQHPDWPSTIFCKTNLHLLPDLHSSDTAIQTREYPVFVEAPFLSKERGKSFEFDGWWRIAGIEYLEPQSPALIAMLERKFSRPTRKGKVGFDRRDQGKVRSAEAWTNSLTRRWALITLEKNKARKDNPVSEFAEATQNYLRSREESNVQAVGQMLSEVHLTEKDVSPVENVATFDGQA